MGVKKELTLFFLVFAGVLAFWWFQKDPDLMFPDQRTLEQAEPLPNFTFENILTEEKIDLEDYRGKILLLSFWAAWCQPCLEELPTMVALHRRLRGHDFEIIAINLDQDPKQVAPPLIREFGMSFPVVIEPEGGHAVGHFEVDALPFNVVVDHKGRVLETESQARNWSHPDVIDYFKRLIDEKDAAKDEKVGGENPNSA
jgi:thiol-disulfide isomerase/thioredoxin